MTRTSRSCKPGRPGQLPKTSTAPSKSDPVPGTRYLVHLIWGPYGAHIGPMGPIWGPYGPMGPIWGPYGPMGPIWARAHIGPMGPIWARALMGRARARALRCFLQKHTFLFSRKHFFLFQKTSFSFFQKKHFLFPRNTLFSQKHTFSGTRYLTPVPPAGPVDPDMLMSRSTRMKYRSYKPGRPGVSPTAPLLKGPVLGIYIFVLG